MIRSRSRNVSSTGRCGLPLFVVAAVFSLEAPVSHALDQAETRGRQIYFEGTSARGGEINAVVGDESTILPAAAIPCANCHGYDGLGRPEGGVIPTDIRWRQLTKSYGHVHEDGRRHPAFDEKSLGISIVAGVDPAGNTFDRSMPIYQMSDEDLGDLVAYLKVLEHDLDPGVQPDSVRVASLLPLEGRFADLGHAMEATLRAAFSEINATGGVFGRTVELVVVPLGSSPEASLQNLQAAFDEEGIFALVGGYTVGLDNRLLDLLRYDNVPLIGPFTLDPGDALLDAAAFYLYPGFAEQVRALADQALEDTGESGRVLVASPADGAHDSIASAAQDRLQRRGEQQPLSANYTRGDAKSLVDGIRSDGAESVLFLGGQDDFDALLAALDAAGLTPGVYVLSSFLQKGPFDAPAAFDRRIHVAHPTVSSDITPEGRAYYQELARSYELPDDHIQAQAASLAAAKVFVEGLRFAGRDLSRTRLVDGIEALYNYQTGFTPPLIYGPNHRIGAQGAHVLAVDLKARGYVTAEKSWRIVR